MAVAGMPPEIGEMFIAKSVKTLPVMSWASLDKEKPYTHSYAAKLYEDFATKLKESNRSNRHELLAQTNLVLLYVEKNNKSEAVLFETFGTEMLLVPLKRTDIASKTLVTGNQKRKVVNDLIKEQRRAIKRARILLSAIAEEVTNRDNKTCLLLPPKNFGRTIKKVLDCVYQASSKGEGKEEFEGRLNHTFQSLNTVRQDSRTYMVGENRLVFKSPSKSGSRHGLAPTWEDPHHLSSCVIQGRIRFGVAYDPKFHYDCDMRRGGGRSFPTCHGFKRIGRNRNHVNIAPNDNVR